MGCTMTTHNGMLMQHEESSATRIFKVTNVDNNGEDRNPGYIEITTDSLVLHQRGKESVAWPLHGLRRYGFDADLFSFESGRRCPTGPGIYAFRCRRAEALFNLLQSSIAVAGQSNAAVAHRAGGGLVESARLRSAMHGASAIQPSNHLMFLQPVAVVRPLRPQMTLSQYRNVPVNGRAVRHPEHVERQSLAQLPDILAMYQQRPEPPVHYAELDLDRHADDESVDEDDVEVFVADEQISRANQTSRQLYINVPSSSTQPTVSNTLQHGYANLDLIADSAAASEAGGDAGMSKVNYIQLDLSTETLDATDEGSPTLMRQTTARTLSLTQNTDVARSTGDSYTTIDFDRTRALNAISVDADEGVRRTRHNSNIV